MAGKARNLIADAIIAIVILVVAWWLLGAIIGSVLWVARIAIVIGLIVAALYVAGRIRKG